MKTCKLSEAQATYLRAAPWGGSPNKIDLALGLLQATQTELAQAVGMTQPNINQIVRDKAGRLALITCQRIAVTLGVGVDDLWPLPTKQRVEKMRVKTSPRPPKRAPRGRRNANAPRTREQNSVPQPEAA